VAMLVARKAMAMAQKVQVLVSALMLMDDDIAKSKHVFCYIILCD
jgi:hypothetical protein